MTRQSSTWRKSASPGSTPHVARAKKLMDHRRYERPAGVSGGTESGDFPAHLDRHSTVRLTEGNCQFATTAVEYGDHWRCSTPPRHYGGQQELVSQAKQQQFYTVLLADDSPATGSGPAANTCALLIRRWCRSVARGGQHRKMPSPAEWQIQAAIIRVTTADRPATRVPADDHAAGHDGDSGGKRDPTTLVRRWIRGLRPRDLYLDPIRPWDEPRSTTAFYRQRRHRPPLLVLAG